MALIVEDGTGLPNANAFASEAEVDAYHATYSSAADSATWTGTAQATKELKIIQATQHLVFVYRIRWKGRRLKDTQSLPWPRGSVRDEDDYVVADNIVPQQLKDATAQLAFIGLTDTLMPEVSAAKQNITKDRTKIGPIDVSKTYSGTKATSKRYPQVEATLEGIIWPGGVLERS